MEFVILFQLVGLDSNSFSQKSLIPFVFTQKGFYPSDSNSIWLLQESAEKES